MNRIVVIRSFFSAAAAVLLTGAVVQEVVTVPGLPPAPRALIS